MDPTSWVPSLGIGDLLVLGFLGLFAAYWFFWRGKKSDAPSKTFTFTPTALPARSGSVDGGGGGLLARMTKQGRTMVVFYGSQTGTAEEFANRLAKESRRYGIKAMVADPEEIDMDEFNGLKEVENVIAVFCMATYGEGDPTDNAQEFHDWLQNGGVPLEGVNFAVFALGNKTYEHYNAMGKLVDRKLEECGARRICELGLGDDDGNMEDDFITWKEVFWKSVCEQFGLAASLEDMNMRQFKCVIHERGSILEERLYTGEVARLKSYVNQRPPYDAKNPYLSPIMEHRELHKGGGRSCMHIEFGVEGTRIRYEAGDHVGVYPMNHAELVNRLGELCKTDLDTIFNLTAIDEDSHKKHPFPCPTTFRTALTFYVDITSLPRTHVLKELAAYCTDPKDKEFLLSMTHASQESKSMYTKWIVNEVRTIIHIIEDTPSCVPALDHLCELLPRLQNRYYSISSSPRVHSNRIHATAVVIDYKTPTGRRNLGVCTSWLQGRELGATVPVFVRKSQFRLPSRSSIPIIMVGPGTGLAPFRGFIQERRWAREEGKEVGETVLFYGCRKRDEDFLYKEELEDFVATKDLVLYTAFSREQEQKVYVQHSLEQQGETVWKLLEKGAHFYVCGDARSMSKDVHSTVVKIASTYGAMNLEEGLNYVKKLEASKRYSADVWS